MKKQRKLKCYGFFCYHNKFKHDRRSLITYNGKNYCNKCLKRKKNQDKYRKVLYHFIEDEWQVVFPTGKMLYQIKEFINERHYTYFGILQSLRYMNETKGMNLTNYYSLGYVPFVYEKARDKWLTQRKQSSNMNKPNTEELGQQINDEIQKVQTKNKHHNKKINPINMNDVLK